MGVGVRLRGFRGWLRDDGVIAFPLGDSSIVKLRNLWVLFCFMPKGRGYIHLKSVRGTPRTVPGTFLREYVLDGRVDE